MGKPGRGNALSLSDEYIVWQGEPGELKHLSTRRKRKQNVISQVVVSERERA